MAKCNVRPLNDRVVVRLDPIQDRTEGGVYLPDRAKKNRTAFGVVVAAGPGTLNEKDGTRTPLPVKAGDRVLVSEFGGVEFQKNGETLWVFGKEQLLAVDPG